MNSEGRGYHERGCLTPPPSPPTMKFCLECGPWVGRFWDGDMLILGEKINTTRPGVETIAAEADTAGLIRLAKRQVDAGADVLDINAGTFREREAEVLDWMARTLQGAVDVPLCLDSPDPAVLAAVAPSIEGPFWVNSISLEKDRLASLLPLVAARPCSVVALCMGARALPHTAEERIRNGEELLGRLHDAGVPSERVYVDPLVQPVSVDAANGPAALDAIAGLVAAVPGVNVIVGLSNLSFGLPGRRWIHRSFLSLALDRGLNAAILDPTDRGLMATLAAANVCLGRDAFCEQYLEAHEGGLLDA